MKLKGFIGGSYSVQSQDINCQRCVNLYAQMDESGTGKNVAALLGTPGLRLFATLDATYPVRGFAVTKGSGRVFAVTFTTLWEVASDGTKTNRGTLNSSSGFVSMAENGRQLMLVDGPNGYSLDLSTNSLTSIADFPGGSTVTFQDGVFIFNQPDTQVFWVTNPAYTTEIDATMFASAESNSDNLLAVLSDHELLWLFGTDSTEVWYNSGAQDFTFERVQGGALQYGLAAQRSPARFANTVGWLGRNDDGQGVVYMAQGLVPQRISTHAIEQELAKYSTIADATGYTYQQDGHEFYVLNFPAGNTTWVYDATTQIWHERAWTGPRGLQRQRGEMHVEAFGKHLVSDWQTGKIYAMDRFALNDAGARITRIRSSPYVTDELKNVFISLFQLDMEMGLGADGVAIDATAPQCMLQWSDDGGKTWSNEYWISLGAIGANKMRAIWRRLGRTRQRVFKITITDDCMVAINDAFLKLTEGTS